MACSRPNLMHFNGFEYTFRGRRNQEQQFRERLLNQEEFPTYDIPCGKCDLCRLERRYTRALRIMLEAESWPESTYFLTLTYDEKNLGHPDLDHKDWAQFIKDFRQEFCQAKYCDVSVPRHYKRYGKIRSKTFKNIKQVMCGEYGDTFGRKHFHGILFNHTFVDMEFTGIYSKKGNPVHTSKRLAEVWKKGYVQVEKITFDLALYVGSYVTDGMDDEGDVNAGHRKKQYGRFGQGIGESWIRKYWRDALGAGAIKTLERDYPIPRYFIEKIREWYPAEYEKWKSKKRLQLLKTRDEIIKKGDGPLRRATVGGKMFKHNHEKRKKDEASKRDSY